MDKSRTHSIYAVYCEDTEEIYIGRSVNPKSRFKQHLSNMGCPVYERAAKYGKDHLYMLVLKTGIPEQSIAAYEAKFIYEFYFRAKLMNRNLPSYSNLVLFCTTPERTDYFCELVDSVEKDLNSKNPRICFPARKQKDFGLSYAAGLRTDVKNHSAKLQRAEQLLKQEVSNGKL